jgi:nucleoside-diphosphate-sugar epimerase
VIDERFSAPRPATVEALRQCPGDVVVLGAGGKMGPSLTLMLRRAADEVADGRRVIAVSRWSNDVLPDALKAQGVDVVRADLLSRDDVRSLPDAPNVVFMAGQKFGTSSAPHATWAMNVLVPSYCAERYAGARIAAFSTGNVYPFVRMVDGGSRENDPLGAVGDYAWSCVGRERMFEMAAARDGTQVSIIRLNYAIELRYGVLLDIARKVYDDQPVSVAMGFVNVIWQEDANRVAIESLAHAATPPFILNVTGSQILSVRDLAERFASRFDRRAKFLDTERPTALLSDTTRMQTLFGPPDTPLDTMIERVADWVVAGGETINKPTHFETRDGRF